VLPESPYPYNFNDIVGPLKLIKKENLDHTKECTGGADNI